MKIKVHRGPSSEISYVDLKPSAKIHIMGICGTAMSSLAGLLKEKGYTVCGSDRHFYPPISEELKQMGVSTFKGYEAQNIHSGLDLVVVGNVISRNLPETQALLSSGLPYVSLPEALNSFVMGGKNTVMVCGTHGKTTVSCLSAWILHECGRNPGFMIGGVSEDFKTGFRLSNSDWFVVEGDEYDTAFFEKTPKCIHYHSTYTLLSNIEFDHADIYRDIKDVERAFRLLMEKKVSSSCLIAGVDSPLVEKLISLTKQKVVTYGIKKGAWRLINREPVSGGGQILHVKNPEGKKMEVKTSLSGEHNALNVLSVWVLSCELNLNLEKALLALKNFQGVRRRFQVLGDFSGVTLIEDFAHHPTAVSAVLQSAREIYPGRRLLALFEPRSNTSRKNIFQEEYQKALSLADLIFCMEAYNSSSIPESERFSSKLLVDHLNQSKASALSRDSCFYGKDGGDRYRAFYAEDVRNMVNLVQKQILKGDVIVIMSNGDFGGIYSLLKTALCAQ